MARNRRRQDERLRELYDLVPVVQCKGLCHGACCFIDASVRERERMEHAGGRRLTTIDARVEGGTRRDARGNLLARYRCSMLTTDGRCSVYEDRPMVCRLYGAAEGLECKFGCQPQRLLLTVPEAVELLVESMHVGGFVKGMLDASVAMRKQAEAHRDILSKRWRSGAI